MTRTDHEGMNRTLRCRLGLHAYVLHVNDEGGRYLVCDRCGRQDFPWASAGPRVM